MNIKHAKYRVPYKRTDNWWSGDWANISSWCSKKFGRDNWDYMHEEFWFKEEKHMTWFLLKWGT